MLEESALQALVEEAERAHALDGEAAAARERIKTKEALTAFHNSRMESLQERLDGLKRAKAAPLRLLAKSYAARMDKGVPRPVARSVRPDLLEPTAPPRDVERPVRVVADCELLEVQNGSRIILVGFSVVSYLLFEVWWRRCEVSGFRASPLC